MAFDRIVRLCGRAIGADTILNRHEALFVFPQRRVNRPLRFAHMTMHDGQVIFFDPATLPECAQRERGFVSFGEYRDATGFAIQPIDEMRARFLTQI